MRGVDHRYDALPSSRVPFLSQLKVYNGIFSHESLWRLFLRPFPLLLSPAVSICTRRLQHCLFFSAYLVDMAHGYGKFSSGSAHKYILLFIAHAS